jgi:hypothetical protein
MYSDGSAAGRLVAADRYACPSCGRWIREADSGSRAECSFCGRWCYPSPVMLGQGGRKRDRRMVDRGVVVTAWGEFDPVGLAEISERLEVQRQTVDAWRHRGRLPEPRSVLSGNPLWDWKLDIEPWARETGRLPGMRKADPIEPEF